MRRLALIIGLVAAVVPGAARAADPPVQWLDDAPASYDVNELRAPGGKIALELHNATASVVPVTVQVTGPPELASLFQPVTLSVPANGRASGTLTVSGNANPKAGSYAGTLVVRPSAGGVLDRRPLTVTVSGSAAQQVNGAQLDAAGLPDVTLPATNYLPSPASEVGPALIAVAAVLLAVLVIWGWWPAGVVTAIVLVAVGVVLGAFDSDPDGMRKIVAKPLPVSANAVEGHAGVVLDGQGDTAELRVRAGELRASSLTHAGEHKGTVDLNGPAEGSAAATVNVRDWWPWALLAIAIGVAVGYLVRKWFDRDRVRARLALRADTLFARVKEAGEAPGARANWIPVLRVEERLKGIHTRLREDATTTAAEQELDALETYIDDTEALRNRVGELDAALRVYKTRRAERDLVDGEKVVAFARAQDALDFAFDSSDATLEDARTKVDDAIDFVETGSDRYGRIAGFVGAVERVLNELDEFDPERAELERAKRELEQCARAALLADGVEKVRDAYDAAVQKVPPDVLPGGAPHADLAPAWIRMVPQQPAARIEARIITPGVDRANAGNVDDLFRFRAVFTDPPAEAVDVVWDFGAGGEPVTQRVPPTGTGPWIECRYAAAGDYSVTLTSAAGTLATHTQQVTGPSRLSTARTALQRRERRFTWIAIGLTIASGLSALYVTDPAWGTNDDYIKALLWGAVVAEGVALVAAIIAQLFPARQ